MSESATPPRGASRPTRGTAAGAAGARLGSRPGAAPPADAEASSTVPAAAGARARPAKASAALQRKQQLGKAPVGGGRQQQMATGFETVRLPAASLQRLGGGVIEKTDGAHGELHAQLSEVFSVMAAAKVTGDDLWQGSPVVRPLIKHFAKDLRAYKPAPDASGQAPATLVSFHFPATSEFTSLGLVEARAYRVERLMPIHVLVQRVLTRLGVGEPKRFTLSTLGGFVLHPEHRLADYGLGSLLPNWELRFVDKADVEREQSAPAPQEEAQQQPGANGTIRRAAFLRESTQTFDSQRTRSRHSSVSLGDKNANAAGAGGAERISLLLVFEDEGVWPQRLQRLAMAPDVSIASVLEAVVERSGLPIRVEQMTLSTFDDDPIDTSATLENYGLGELMTRWAVKLRILPDALEQYRATLAAATATTSTPTHPVEAAAVAQTETQASAPTQSQEQPSSADEVVSALRVRVEQLSEELQRVQASEAEQREQSAKVMARAQKLREHLEQERASLRTQLDAAQQRIEELEGALAGEKAERERQSERQTKRIEALEAQLKERSEAAAKSAAPSEEAQEEQALLEASMANMTRVIEDLELELSHAQTRLAEQKTDSEAKLERLKERQKEQSHDIEALSGELVKAQGSAEREAKARQDAERRVAELEAKVAALEAANAAALPPPIAAKLDEALPEPDALPPPPEEPVAAAPAPVPASSAAVAPSAASAPAAQPEVEILRQWVEAVVDKSSEAADPDAEYDDWAATQLIGPPKISAYGDSGNAWAPFETNGGHEWVTLRFRRRVLVREVLILESWNPGAITKVELQKPDGSFEAVWSHVAEAAPPELRILQVLPEPEPSYATDTIKIHLDTATVGDNEWNEIAAVQLAGIAVEPEPARDVKSAATAPPPPPPPMTLPTPPPLPGKKATSAAGAVSAGSKKAASTSGDLMTDLLAVVQQGKGGLRSTKDTKPAQKPKPEEPSDSIAAVLLKRFNAMHGAGKYEDLSGGDDWADEASKADDAEWEDDDVW